MWQKYASQVKTLEENFAANIFSKALISLLYKCLSIWRHEKTTALSKTCKKLTVNRKKIVFKRMKSLQLALREVQLKLY